MSRSRSVVAVFVVLFFALAASSSTAAPVKGRFAFYYAWSLTDEELAWFQRFDVFVPGNILPDDQVSRLRQAGSRLFFYAWATGMYLDDPTHLTPGSWEAKVYGKRNQWLLNPNGPSVGPDGGWRTYYYDPYPKDFQRAQAAWLDGLRRAEGYDGVFFDLVGSMSVPREMRAVYRSRHPRKAYDKALAEAFKTLRAKGSLIFTNQGYRDSPDYLPVSHFDLSESVVTSYAWGEPVRIFVEGEGLVERLETYYCPWERVKLYLGDIQAQVDRYNPSLGMYHLNYVNVFYRATGSTEVVDGIEYPVFRKEVDRPAIYYGYAAAKLWGQESYSPAETVALSRDEVYFTDLGAALGHGYEERDGAAVRYYENGVVVVGTSTLTRTVDLDSSLIPSGVNGFWDLYAGQPIAGRLVTVEPTHSEASGRLYPAGRVYLYVR